MRADGYLLSRRATLLPNKKGKTLEWNVVLQGRNETVFFDY